MINITVDLTGVTARLDKMQDYFSPGKTDSGKKFISLISDAGVDIFQENSLERMQTNKPPGTKKSVRGKRKSMKNFAKKFTENLFISQQSLTSNGVIIGIGVDFYSIGTITPPVEPEYIEGIGKFKNWIQSLGIYDFAPDAAENLFFIRHFGSGARGIISSYTHRRMYPNNFNLSTISGRLFKADTVKRHFDLAVSEVKEDTYEVDERSIRIQQKKKARLIKKNQESIKDNQEQLFEFLKGEESRTGESSRKSLGGYDNPVFNQILSNIADESISDFLKGNFNSVTTKGGYSLLMWSKGVRPYDWFHNTGYGASTAAAYAIDVFEIGQMIEDAYKRLAKKI